MNKKRKHCAANFSTLSLFQLPQTWKSSSCSQKVGHNFSKLRWLDSCCLTGTSLFPPVPSMPWTDWNPPPALEPSCAFKTCQPLQRFNEPVTGITANEHMLLLRIMQEMSLNNPHYRSDKNNHLHLLDSTASNMTKKEGRWKRQTTTESSPIALSTQGVHNIALHYIKAERVLCNCGEALLPLKLLLQMRPWTKIHFQQLKKVNIFIERLQRFKNIHCLSQNVSFFSKLTHPILDFLMFVYMTTEKIFLCQHCCTNCMWKNIVTVWLKHNTFLRLGLSSLIDYRVII